MLYLENPIINSIKKYKPYVPRAIQNWFGKTYYLCHLMIASNHVMIASTKLSHANHESLITFIKIAFQNILKYIRYSKK